MYFLWKNTPYGIIRISCDGLYDFADDVLKSGLRLYSITLSPSRKKDDADLIIVMSDENIIPEVRHKIDKHFASIMKPMGISPSIVWASPERGIFSLVHSPYTWAAVASCSAVIITAGFDGFFWSVFWGTAAWFAVRGISLLVRYFRRA